MKLENNSAPFEIIFDGATYPVPSGKFTVTEKLGGFISKKAIQWGFNVKTIENEAEQKIEKIAEPVEPKLKESKVEEPIEEPVEPKKVKIGGATIGRLPKKN